MLGVDVESDTRHAPPGGGVAADGFERTVEYLSALRPRLERATGAQVQYAWFVRMDPQTAAQGGTPHALLEAAPGAMRQIVEAGDAVGLHTHAGRWHPTHSGWVTDHADAAWIDECLVASAAGFEDRFGLPCREHRFGDRFSSPAVFDRLAQLGVQVDLTPEPGQPGSRRPAARGAWRGHIPDYRNEPHGIRQHGSTELAILPLTSVDPAPSMPVLKRWLRAARYPGQPRYRTLLLDRHWPSARMPWDLAENRLVEGLEHLAFILRSDLILGPRWPATRAVLDALPGHQLAGRLAFMGGEQAAAYLLRAG